MKRSAAFLADAAIVCGGIMQKTDAKWIWNANTNFDAHQYAVFRKEFTIKGRSAALHITADTRYQLYLNG